MTLLQLDDAQAVSRFDDALHLRLYRRTSHLVKQIPEDAYRRIFETRWTDRCTHAGWNVTFAYGADDSVELHMKRAH